MDDHLQIVGRIASDIQLFFKLGKPYRIFHGSSNSTRPRPGREENVIDISALRRVISVDAEARTALVEPNVSMDCLVEATMKHNLVPPVVMEFPGITAGGGFSGTSAESSSFRHGFFNDTINYVEIILANGEVVKASPTERSDLFQAAAGAAGTLGVVTLIELRLIKAKAYVRTVYNRTGTVEETVEMLKEKTNDMSYNYIDGILFSKAHGVVVVGEMTDEIPHTHNPQTFSNAGDPWFYMHVQEKTQHLTEKSSLTEYIPLCEYLFRYDRAAFWVGRHGYTYFKHIPFNSFFRWLLDDFSHTRTLYHALHASGISSEFIVQDVGLPYETAEAFINFVDKSLGIWPLWLCPLKEAVMPTFHPITSGHNTSLLDGDDTAAPKISRPMLNIGVWGWGPSNHDDFVMKNREIESELVRLGGRKWLYAHTYYSEDEFWSIYDRTWYQTLREKYQATSLPSVFDKVRIDVNAKRRECKERTPWRTWWPVGGLYGMWLAWKSGDIGCHRNAEWKYVK